MELNVSVTNELDCARLLAGWVTTLRLSRPLSVSQHGQLSHPSLIIIIIIRSRRQQRSVASTQSGHDDERWTIQHEC